jgi:ribosomal protein L30E
VQIIALNTCVFIYHHNVGYMILRILFNIFFVFQNTGTACGKYYRVSMLSVTDAGDSDILRQGADA